MNIRFVDVEGARQIRGGAVVVVDVMRAYTVAAWALHMGASELILVDDVEQAVAVAAEIPESLLCKDGAPDPRFHLHNSPRHLLDLNVTGRTIVQRTTAGTRAAVAVQKAAHLFCASFVVASATAKALRSIGPGELTFVVSGGLEADEDLACAEYIAELVKGDKPDERAFLNRAFVSAAANDLREGVAKGFRGVSEHDVAMCLELDKFHFAMQAQRTGGQLRLRANEL
jgi:2-phosphosulfolactate phosphatase